jgi:hypothetical protein
MTVRAAPGWQLRWLWLVQDAVMGVTVAPWQSLLIQQQHRRGLRACLQQEVQRAAPAVSCVSALTGPADRAMRAHVACTVKTARAAPLAAAATV